MTSYDQKPWLRQYAEGQPEQITHDFDDALAMFKATAARHPETDAIRYFGASISYRELDELTDALACAFRDRGLKPGERVALYLQNVPQFVIALVATWKAGGVAVSVNPMNRARELQLLLEDSGAAILVCLEDLYRDVAAEVVPTTGVRVVVTTSELEYLAEIDERVLSGITAATPQGTESMADLIEQFRGQVPPAVTFSPGETAFLTYTSGTTGPPKGAKNTHGNVVFNSQTYREWVGLGSDDVIYGIAPLFHITGLIAHVGVSLLTGATLLLSYRFDPAAAIDTFKRERPTFTMGSITVFIALMNAENADKDAFASVKTVLSGGAPIPPSTINAFQSQFGRYIHNAYGLTETTSPSHLVPLGATAPVDPTSGALSVGVPVFNTIVRVVGEDGRDLPVGEVGEIVTSGPQVVAGYWNKPEETEKAIPAGSLHTGDVGYMDADGWFYIVDRKKDQINAGGYKIWPREVEDVLYEHPAVREAAVVGVADPYRGETVKAFVSLRPGQQAEPEELIAFCKERMAAYKYPRQVEILGDLPKTVTGKLLRRDLRDSEPATTP